MSVMVRRGEATATARCSELRPGVSNINEHSDAVYFLDEVFERSQPGADDELRERCLWVSSQFQRR
jgi:hypothetical protein